MNTKLTINPNRIALEEAYMQMAEVWAKRSKANRLQVGCIIVKDQQIISDGYNGMPAGMEGDDEVCETLHYPDTYHGVEVDGPFSEYTFGPMVLKTKPMLLHAEANALMKLAKNGGKGAEGATLYTVYSPCPECAKLIKQANIEQVFFRHHYRLPEGVEMLRKLGVRCHQLPQEQPLKEAPSDLSNASRFPAMAKPTVHDWKSVSGHGGHNGEYDHVCTKCGARDWIARYGDITDLPAGPCVPK